MSDLVRSVRDHQHLPVQAAQWRVDDGPVAFFEGSWPARVLNVVPDWHHDVGLAGGDDPLERFPQLSWAHVTGIGGILREQLEEIPAEHVLPPAAGCFKITLVDVENHAVWRHQRERTGQGPEDCLIVDGRCGHARPPDSWQANQPSRTPIPGYSKPKPAALAGGVVVLAPLTLSRHVAG